MQREHSPPGFWQRLDDEALVDGIELESAVRTRFFQTVDPWPRSWGRLSWRIQVNKILAGRIGLPLFRTFYPGIEWNLSHPDYRWFLTAWFRWEPRSQERGQASWVSTARIEGDTVLFSIPPADPAFDGVVYLRSRVDARDQRGIAQAVRLQSEQPAPEQENLIVLDDFIDR